VETGHVFVADLVLDLVVIVVQPSEAS